MRVHESHDTVPEALGLRLFFKIVLKCEIPEYQSVKKSGILQECTSLVHDLCRSGFDFG